MELIDAITNKDVETVSKLLFNNDVNPNTRTKTRSVLSLAYSLKAKKIANLLIIAGADEFDILTDNETKLFKAIYSGNSKTVERLIKEGVSVHIRDPKTDMSTLYTSITVDNPHIEIVEKLIGANADMNETYQGETLMSVAVKQFHMNESYIDIVSTLEDNQASGYLDLDQSVYDRGASQSLLCDDCGKYPCIYINRPYLLR